MRFIFSKNKKKYRGELVYTGECHDKAQLLLLNRNKKGEYIFIKDTEDLDFKKGKHILLFKNLSDTNELQNFGKKRQIDDFLLDDIVNLYQRPKVQLIDKEFFITIRRVRLEDDKLIFSPVSIFGDENGLSVFLDSGNDDLIKNFLERINNKKSPFKENDIYYSVPLILDIITSEYLVLLDDISFLSQEIEIRVLDDKVDVEPKEIFLMKKKVYDIKNIIKPSKEVINTIINSDIPLFGDEERLYFYEVNEHITQTLEHLDRCADTLRSLFELQLTVNGNKMNEVMKILSVIGTIFIPLTFIAGVYGMNFEFIPELSFRYGYPITIGVMVMIVIFLLLWFKRRKWI